MVKHGIKVIGRCLIRVVEFYVVVKGRVWNVIDNLLTLKLADEFILSVYLSDSLLNRLCNMKWSEPDRKEIRTIPFGDVIMVHGFLNGTNFILKCIKYL